MLFRLEVISPTGGVYFAWSPRLQCMKDRGDAALQSNGTVPGHLVVRDGAVRAQRLAPNAAAVQAGGGGACALQDAADQDAQGGDGVFSDRGSDGGV